LVRRELVPARQLPSWRSSIGGGVVRSDRIAGGYNNIHAK